MSDRVPVAVGLRPESFDVALRVLDESTLSQEDVDRFRPLLREAVEAVDADLRAPREGRGDASE